MVGRRYFVGRRWLGKRQTIQISALLLTIALFLLTVVSAIRVRPLLESMAVTGASNAVTRIVFAAVDEAIEHGDICYTDLISYEKDNEGRITALHSNMAAFNRLQASILDKVVERIDRVSARELSIPVGSLTGSTLLSGRGPRIHVRMESMGSSTARFENQFVSAGINQTKHQIILHIDVFVTILLPGMTTTAKVSNVVTVAETVIVGTVPQTYTYFATDPSAYAEDAKDYVLNNS